MKNERHLLKCDENKTLKLSKNLIVVGAPSARNQHYNKVDRDDVIRHMPVVSSITQSLCRTAALFFWLFFLGKIRDIDVMAESPDELQCC